MQNDMKKLLQHFFSHFLKSQKKIAWHTFQYGPKIIQRRLALFFFFSFLSVQKATSVHSAGGGDAGCRVTHPMDELCEVVEVVDQAHGAAAPLNSTLDGRCSDKSGSL